MKNKYISSVYQLSFPNCKSYIGKGNDPDVRLGRHLKAVMNGSSFAIHNAIRKYGKPEIFILAILEGKTQWEAEEKAFALENKLVDLCGTLSPFGYNLKGGGGGFPFSDEIKAKMSRSMKGNKNSLGIKRTQKDKDHLSKINKGHIVSQETRDKISASLIGRKGRKHTQETKDKLSKIHKGKKFTQEIKDKIGKASKGNKYCLGRKVPQETKNKISEALKGNKIWLGKKHTQESKKKISEAQKGKKLNQLTKAKMLKGQRIRRTRERINKAVTFYRSIA